MQKIMIISFCFISTLYAMEQQPVRQACEWDAQMYSEGNLMQEKMAFEFLEQAKIDLVDKDIVDVGCGTGNISAIMAQKAKSVHGFDASTNMIDYDHAKYSNIPNLTFSCCSAEDFTSSIIYDLCTAFFCLHWVEDKKAVLQRIYENLKEGGQALGNITTASNKQHTSLQVFHEMLPGLSTIISFLKTINATQALGRSAIMDDEFENVLKSIGFKIVSIEKKALHYIFKNREEVAAFQRPQVMSRPFVQWVPKSLHEYLFNSFIDKYMEKFEKTEEGYLFSEETTVFHIQK